MGATNFLAVDLGASGGRVVLGRWEGERFRLQELHRFPNGPVSVPGQPGSPHTAHLHWDVLRLWSEIKAGLALYGCEFGEPLSGIGVDTWAVDYALLDGEGQLLGNPYHYRDSRTDGAPDELFRYVPKGEVFQQTGIQSLQFNTIFQLWRQVQAGNPLLAVADTMLLMPDLFGYWLSGRKVAEYTNATTTNMLDCKERRWATGLLAGLGLPAQLLPPLVPPGTVLGEMRPRIALEVGLQDCPPVIAPATHDTASAVAAIPNLDEESAYISSGTWSLVGVETREPVLTERAMALNFTNEGGVAGTYRLLKNVTGLWLLQECLRRWEREGEVHSWEEILEFAERAEPFRSLIDPDDPAFLGPGDMPAAIVEYCRRTDQPQPQSAGAMTRCCLESIALKYRWVLDSLETLTGRRLGTVRIVGGGSRNRLLCQFTADACARPVVAGPVEATALGNIMVQAVAVGHLDSIQHARKVVGACVERQRYEPAESALWEEAFRRFSALLH